MPAKDQPFSRHLGGGDANGAGDPARSRDELYQRARRLGIKGASRMKKEQLAEAIARGR